MERRRHEPSSTATRSTARASDADARRRTSFCCATPATTSPSSSRLTDRFGMTFACFAEMPVEIGISKVTGMEPILVDVTDRRRRATRSSPSARSRRSTGTTRSTSTSRAGRPGPRRPRRRQARRHSRHRRGLLRDDPARARARRRPRGDGRPLDVVRAQGAHRRPRAAGRLRDGLISSDGTHGLLGGRRRERRARTPARHRRPADAGGDRPLVASQLSDRQMTVVVFVAAVEPIATSLRQAVPKV